MCSIPDGLVVHPVAVAETAETVDLPCTSHDHVEGYRDEVETVPNSGTFDAVVEGGTWQNIS